MHRAIFLDRDGTLTRDVGFTHRVDDLELLSGAAEGLQTLAAAGFRLVLVTNQSGIARGLFSEADMHIFHRALEERLASLGVRLAGIYFCPFHPTSGQREYCRESPLRKPAPGMLLAAAADLDLDLASSFAIGDKRSDIAAGAAAGCRTILVQTGMAGRGEPELAHVVPDYTAADLAAAAQIIARVSNGQ